MSPPLSSASAAAVPVRALAVLRSREEVEAYLATFGSTGAHALRRESRVDIEVLCAERPGDAEFARLCAVAAQFDVPLYLGEPYAVDAMLTDIVPASFARSLDVVAMAATVGFAAIGTSRYGSVENHAKLEFLSKRRLVAIATPKAVLRRMVSESYDRVEDESLIRTLGIAHRTNEAPLASVEAERLSNERPVVRLVADVLDRAVRRRASDIHVRPGEHDFEVLYRIDGELVSERRFLKPLQAAVVSRLKVLGGMNLAEHRVPQDGRATHLVDGAPVELRLSVLPTVHGEAVVLRVLDGRAGLRDLSTIGFDAHDRALFSDLLTRDHGLVLVTGPTGCGKSTTLYAALLECRKQGINIVTVEDPVEYPLADVLQVPVNRPAGLTFARALRNILRHDPDVVMIGEVRDGETAEIAVESALTGHLVFSTLHTNNAATAVTRLLDLEVAPFLLKSTLLAVLAQRLARRNCVHCLVDEPLDVRVREMMGVAPSDRFKVGAGCPECNGTGVHGRVAIYELLDVTPTIRALIRPDADATAIHEEAVSQGMRTITQHALSLARAGTISLREAHRARVD